MKLEFPAGKRIQTHMVRGLCYIKWEDFAPVKDALAKSHANDRKSYDTNKCCHRVEVSTTFINETEGIVASGDVVSLADLNPDDVSSWMNWCSGKMTDDEKFVQATIAGMEHVCRADEYDRDCE